MEFLGTLLKPLVVNEKKTTTTFAIVTCPATAFLAVRKSDEWVLEENILASTLLVKKVYEV